MGQQINSLILGATKTMQITLVLTDKARMKRQLNKSIIGLGIFALVVGLYCIYIDLTEIANRLKGEYTYFSQRAWLTDKQAIIYCLLWALVYLILLSILIIKILSRNNKLTTIFSISILTITIISFWVDTLFYVELP